MDFISFKQKSKNFLTNLEKQMSDQNIKLQPHWNIDHICYRVETTQQYQKMKNDFADFAAELIESEVNGRMISTYKLDEPIFWNEQKIDLVELPAPKPNKSCVEGFEHIEVVCDQTFDELKSIYDNCTLKEDGLSKDFNRELAIQLEGCSIKFHHLSLESVINLEHNRNVHCAIMDLGVLKKLKCFAPEVAGTFPLGIETENSDVDILLYSKDLDLALEKIKTLYNDKAGFQSSKSIENGSEYVIANFIYKDVPFELFVQSVPTVRQRAYKHFQVEERLLKLGGETLKNQIRKLRDQGIKAEPAFAKVLGLDGNPYVALLELHNLTEKMLESLLLQVKFLQS